MKITREDLVKFATFGGKIRFNEKMRDMYIPTPKNTIVRPPNLRHLTSPSRRYNQDLLGGLTPGEVRRGNERWAKSLKRLRRLVE